ncbi:MAG: glycosyltransferase family 4 protein [Candidatus Methanoperedens sp.]|nr:glycosyltransferase family 4 protein [Candidatus Methanoperedens sp.]
MKKKILIVMVHSLYPISHGGILRVIEELKFLSQNGFEVHIIGNRTNKIGLDIVEKYSGAKAYTFSKITYLTASILSKLGFLTLGWIYNPLVKRDIEKIVVKIRPDIVQAEFIHVAFQVSRICKKFNIPFIISEHNVESIRLLEEGNVSGSNIKLIERNVCNFANFISTVSDKDKEELRKIGVISPIKVIPNGIDYGRYQITNEDKERLRKKYGIKKEDIVLIFHGTLSYLPNLIANKLSKEFIFPNLNKIQKNLKLLLIGPGRSLNIGSKIIELPEIPFGELPIHLSMGDIGIVPLIAGSGTRLKIIEYLALGIPTVSTKVGAEGLPISDGENIIIAKDAKDDFIEKTYKLINDSQLRKRLNENGKKLAKEKLDWNVVLKGYLEIYKELEQIDNISRD